MYIAHPSEDGLVTIIAVNPAEALPDETPTDFLNRMAVRLLGERATYAIVSQADLPDGLPESWEYVAGQVRLKLASARTRFLVRLRERRDALLEDTDRTVIPNLERSVAVPADLLAYRQSLRDLPATVASSLAAATSPADFRELERVMWPTRP